MLTLLICAELTIDKTTRSMRGSTECDVLLLGAFGHTCRPRLSPVFTCEFHLMASQSFQDLMSSSQLMCLARFFSFSLVSSHLHIIEEDVEQD